MGDIGADDIEMGDIPAGDPGEAGADDICSDELVTETPISVPRK